MICLENKHQYKDTKSLQITDVCSTECCHECDM